MDDQKTIHDLTLMLIYLTSWKEKREPARRAWKGYDFDVLNGLVDEGLLYDTSHRSKSTYLTPEGEGEAQALLERYRSMSGEAD